MRRLSLNLNSKFLKILDQKSLRPFYKIFLSSIIIVCFFYVMPIFINYSTNKTFVFKNNSKEILAYTLSNDGKDIKEGDAFLDEKIRPAVARDGGDIKFKEFKNGVVKVQLQGSCSGCPSSTMTLKQGVQNLLCHYLPEVKEVVAI